MKKGIIGLVIFCLLTLALFTAFAYLLAHVDPPRISPLPTLPESGKAPKEDRIRGEPSKAEPRKESPKKEPPTTVSTDATEAKESFFMRRKGYELDDERPFEINSYKREIDDDNVDVETATKVTIILETKILNTTENHIDNATEVVRHFSPVDDDGTELASNSAQLISTVKGFRRLVGNKGKEVDPDNPLLLKIMDDKGKPRLEILIGNNGGTMEKVGKKNRLPRSKTKSKLYMFLKGDNNTIVNKANEFNPTVIRVMPNNSLVLNDPDDLSGYSYDRSYNSIFDRRNSTEERFASTIMDISRFFLAINNSFHEVDDNFTNFKTNTKYSDIPYTIKVRFDNKTEILSNKNNIDKLKQNITNS